MPIAAPPRRPGALPPDDRLARIRMLLKSIRMPKPGETDESDEEDEEDETIGDMPPPEESGDEESSDDTAGQTPAQAARARRRARIRGTPDRPDMPTQVNGHY